MPNVIPEFQGEYRWLSNFAPVVVWYDGRSYITVEHAYQASKTEDYDEREAIRACRKPGDAKRMGRTVTIESGFEGYKRKIMLGLLRQKFRQVPYRSRLLATGNAEIVEGNTWGDRYWGVCRGTGENVLGKLIMQVRDELRAE